MDLRVGRGEGEWSVMVGWKEEEEEEEEEKKWTGKGVVHIISFDFFGPLILPPPPPVVYL